MFPELFSFRIYRALTTCEELKKVVKDLERCKKAFRSARAFPEDGSSSLSTVRAPKTMKIRPDSRVNSGKAKVENLAEKLVELSLIVMKSTEKKNKNFSAETEKICSYCNESGHYAISCPTNTHPNTCCTDCEKNGHDVNTCCSKKNTEEANVTLHENYDEEEEVTNHCRKKKIRTTVPITWKSS